ncbi:neuronal acetylcholine receptor subunit alpha-10-like [Convolutriloba macropyga]|uniref:neuronal acetylcholine receptor subunit alpha-10-like n=1 Tax=Convolutriloba macropyga TaxID=536237 RepID=UPI003F51EE12
MQQINTSVSGIFAQPQQVQPGTMLASTGKVMKPEPFNEVRLVEYIMEGYNTAARPVRNITTTTTLEISLYVIQILKLSEKDQIMTSTVWLNLEWRDEFLRWDKDAWGIQQIRMPGNLIWNPDLTLYNNAQENDPIIKNMKASFAVVSHDGHVTLWPRPLILQSNCPIDVLYFPFDIQNCTLKFSSWAYNVQQLKIVTTSGIHLSSYIPSTEWELIHAQAVIEYNPFDEEGGYSFVQFQLRIQRKSLYYIVNLILPCIMLSLVMLFGQYLPCNSGDAKVQLGTALFTSMCVFLLLVGTMMPPSDVQPLLGVYYCATLFLITFSTAINVFVLNIVDRDTPVPKWIRIVFLHYVARVVAPSLQQPYWVRKTSGGHYTPKKLVKANSRMFSSTRSSVSVDDSNKDTIFTFETANHHLNGHVVEATNLKVNKGHHHHHQQQAYSSRLASNSPVYKTTMYPQKMPDSPIREITELKLDENGKQLVQVRKYLEWIRAQLETMMSDVWEKNELGRLRSDWQCVAVIVDRTLMIVFTLVFLITILWIYYQFPSHIIHPQHTPAMPNIVIE